MITHRRGHRRGARRGAAARRRGGARCSTRSAAPSRTTSSRRSGCRRSTTRRWTASPCAAPSSRPGAAASRSPSSCPAGTAATRARAGGRRRQDHDRRPAARGRRHRRPGRAAPSRTATSWSSTSPCGRAPTCAARVRTSPSATSCSRRGARLGPAELGLLASVGCERVPVARRPRVAILATGSELVPARASRSAPARSATRTRFTAYGQVLEAGAEPVLLGIARDDLDGDAAPDRRRARARRRHHVGRRVGGRVRLRQAGAGRARRRAPLLGRRHQAGQAARLRRARRRRWSSACPATRSPPWCSFELYVRPALLALQGRPDIYRPYVDRRRRRSRSSARRTAPRRAAAGCVRRDGALGVLDDGAAGFGHPALDGARPTVLPSCRPATPAREPGAAVRGAAARRAAPRSGRRTPR